MKKDVEGRNNSKGANEVEHEKGIDRKSVV